ncbi:hypothetical protein ES705_42125 [subsurface metagenome]
MSRLTIINCTPLAFNFRNTTRIIAIRVSANITAKRLAILTPHIMSRIIIYIAISIDNRETVHLCVIDNLCDFRHNTV